MPKCFAVLELLFSHAKGHSIKWKRLNEPKEERRGLLPVTRKEMEERGWDQCDFVYVCGDAYVDHSSFGMAIITRLLEANGYKVGIIAQPDWHDPASIDVFGEPRLAFLVSAGNMDSMVCHYTVAKKHRNRDFYSPGGKMGLRPDHASVVYGNLIRRTYKDAPDYHGRRGSIAAPAGSLRLLVRQAETIGVARRRSRHDQLWMGENRTVLILIPPNWGSLLSIVVF